MKQAIIVVVAALVLVGGGTFFVLTRDDMPNLLPELGPPVAAGYLTITPRRLPYWSNTLPFLSTLPRKVALGVRTPFWL